MTLCKPSSFFDLLGRVNAHSALNTEAIKTIIENDPSRSNIADIGGVLPIHIAAGNGSVNHVQTLCENGSNVDSVTLQGRTPLHYAAMTDNAAVVDFLISSGANIDHVDYILGCTPILYAAIFNRLPSMLTLIKAECKLNVKDKTGRNLLHYAAWNYQIELCLLLIQQSDIDINEKDNNGCTALHYAAGVGSVEIVKILINNKSNLLSLNADGHIPLHLAAAGGYVEVVQEFLILNVPFNYISRKNKNTPLYYAAMSNCESLLQYFIDCNGDIGQTCSKAQTPLHSAAMGGYLDNIRLLVELGANIIMENEEKQTPLHIVAKYGYEDCVEYLLRKAPHTAKYRDSNGYTPMNLAAFGKHVGSFELLLESEANSMRWKDKNQMTKLHWASCAGSVTTIRNILHNRGDVSVRDKNQRTPLHWAISNNNEDSVRILLEHGASATAICSQGNSSYHFAAKLKSPQIVSILLGLQSFSVDGILNQDNLQNLNPLYLAALFGASDTILLLATRCNMLCIGQNGDSVLHRAILSECTLEAIQCLVLNGASTTFKNHLGEIPLHYVCKKDLMIDVATWLLSQETKYETVNHKSNSGVTPLHVAASYGSVIICNVLLMNGADPTIKDDNGLIPIDYAVKRNHQNCVRLLENKTAPVVSESDSWLDMEA